MDTGLRRDSLRMMSHTVGVAAVSSAVAVSMAQPIDVAAKAAKKGNVNILQAMGKIVREKGFGGLFRGNQFQILRKVPAKAIRIMTYEWSNAMLNKFRSRTHGPVLPRSVDNLFVSTFSAMFAVAVTYPLNVLHYYHSKGLSLTSITRASMYRGLAPLCMSTIPSAVVELYTYNAMRDRNGGSGPNFVALMTMSLVAGMVGQTFAQPFKLVSKRMALAEGMSMHRTVSQIVAEQGPMGLFQDIHTKYMKTAVSILAAKLAGTQIERLDGALSV